MVSGPPVGTGIVGVEIEQILILFNQKVSLPHQTQKYFRKSALESLG